MGSETSAYAFRRCDRRRVNYCWFRRRVSPCGLDHGRGSISRFAIFTRRRHCHIAVDDLRIHSRLAAKFDGTFTSSTATCLPRLTPATTQRDAFIPVMILEWVSTGQIRGTLSWLRYFSYPFR